MAHYNAMILVHRIQATTNCDLGVKDEYLVGKHSVSVRQGLTSWVGAVCYARGKCEGPGELYAVYATHVLPPLARRVAQRVVRGFKNLHSFLFLYFLSSGLQLRLVVQALA